MAALGLARFVAEVSQNVRHAFTAPENGASATKVKGTHWNAAHAAPDVEMGAMPGLSDDFAPGTTVIFGQSRWQKRLAQATAIRIQAFVVEALAGGALVLQYTTDLTGVSGWTTAASVSLATVGHVVSDWAEVPEDALAEDDVLLRWVVTA